MWEELLISCDDVDFVTCSNKIKEIELIKVKHAKTIPCLKD